MSKQKEELNTSKIIMEVNINEKEKEMLKRLRKNKEEVDLYKKELLMEVLR